MELHRSLLELDDNRLHREFGEAVIKWKFNPPLEHFILVVCWSV
jgi:hypothetical protein